MFIYLEPGRRIPFVWALEDGYYPEDESWRLLWFRGSAFCLRDDLAFLGFPRMRAALSLSHV